MAEDPPGDFAGRFLGTLATNVAIGLVGLATGLIAARFLGPTLRGELAAMQLWPTALATIAVLGLPKALVYFYARPGSSGSVFAMTSVVLSSLAALVMITAGWFLLPVVLAAQSEEVIRGARLVLIVLLNAALFLPYHAFQGRGEFRRWNLFRLIPPVIWLTILVVFTFAGKKDPLSLALTFAISMLVFSVASLFWIVRVKLGPPYRPNRRHAAGLLRYGFPNLLAEAPNTINLRLDQLLIAALVDSRLLGLYVVAVSWSGILKPIASALGSPLFPQIAGEGDVGRQLDLFARGIRLAILLVAGSSILLLVVTPFGLPLLFGSAFSEATTAAIILVLATGVLSVGEVAQEGVRGLGQPSAVGWAQLVGATATVVSLVILLPRLEIVGAAVASLLGYSATTAFLLHSAIRGRRVNWSQLILPRRDDIALAIGAVRAFRGRAGSQE